MINLVPFIIAGLLCAMGYIFSRWLSNLGELKHLRMLVFNYMDFSPTCNEDNTCFCCGNQWFPNECEPTCLAILMWQAVSEARQASMMWLELLDDLEECREAWRPK